jgi:hypothetical protein
MSNAPELVGLRMCSRGARALRSALPLLFLVSFWSVDTAAAGASAHAIVGSVKVQRPGTDGNPGVGALIVSLFVNKPKPLAEGTVLQDQDGLRGESANAAVQLVCANGATLMLTGEFDAFLRLGNNSEGCTVYLRGGTAVATTAPGSSGPATIPTVIEYGNVTLGARSTQFGATVVSSAGAKNVQADAFVIEGEVDVKSSDPQAAAQPHIRLIGGQLLRASDKQVTAIEISRFESLATTYAKLEVRAVPEAQRAAAQQELQVAYAQSMRRPTDVQTQSALLNVYQSRGLAASPAANYRQYRVDTELRELAGPGRSAAAPERDVAKERPVPAGLGSVPDALVTERAATREVGAAKK